MNGDRISPETRFSLEEFRELDRRCEALEKCLADGRDPELVPFIGGLHGVARKRVLAELAFSAIALLGELGVERPIKALEAANLELWPEVEAALFERMTTRRGATRDDLTCLRVRCPECRTIIESESDTDLDRIECPSCATKIDLLAPYPKFARGGQHGDRIAHYELREKIGVGSFGVVWRAVDTKLNRLVAIKVLHEERIDAKSKATLLREARSVAQLNHPNIVPVYEWGTHGESFFIVSAFIDGQTLDEWLFDQRPTARRATELCVPIAEALHYAHECKLVHRDLTPRNILVDSSGSPHLVDFGLARHEGGEITMTMDGDVLGTPAYMSPEQAQGRSRAADRRSDIYSLGAIFFELLTGERPFRGNYHELMRQAIHDEPPSPRKLNASVHRDLETIVLRCLEKDPRGRFRTADDFAAELKRFLAGFPIHSRPVGHLERCWRWSKRHKAFAGAMMLLAVLAVAIVGWGMREISLAREGRLQLSDILVKNAELHGRKGEWGLALKQLTEAESLGNRDPVRLQLERIHALESLNQKERALRELDALAKREDLGAHKAGVLMLQGMGLLASEGLRVAEPMLREATAIGGRAESDQRLINCMLAETSHDALSEIRAAVVAEPYDHESRRFLVFMLSCLGRFDAARRQAEAAVTLFPDDPNFALLLAHLAAIEGRPKEIDKNLELPSTRQMDQNILKEYARGLHMIHEFRANSMDLWDFARLYGISSQKWNVVAFQEWLFQSEHGELPKESFSDQVRELQAQFELVGRWMSPGIGLVRYGDLQSPTEIITRGPKCFAIAYEPLAQLFALRTRGFLEEGRGNVVFIDGLINRLAESRKAHAEGFLSYAQGQLLFVRGRLQEAADVFVEASTQFSYFGDYQSASLFAAARAWFEVYRQGDEAALAQAVGHMQERLDRASLARHHAEALYEIAIEGDDHTSVRRLINKLAAHGMPRDEYLLRHARNERDAGAFQVALQYAGQVDPASSQAANAQEVIEDCRQSLRQLIERAPLTVRANAD